MSIEAWVGRPKQRLSLDLSVQGDALGAAVAWPLCFNLYGVVPFGVGMWLAFVLQSCAAMHSCSWGHTADMLAATAVLLPAGVAPRREPLVVEKPEEAEPAPV